MSFETYTQFQDAEASEKLGLVILEAGQRLVGWEAYQDFVYVLEDIPETFIEEITENGTELTEASSLAAVNAAGKYYFDRSTSALYLWSLSSGNPNAQFIACTYRMFFADMPLIAPHDLDTGFEVQWRPLLKSTGDFTLSLDNKNLLGFAIEGSGQVNFFNDQEFWRPRFDKYTFENKRCFVYSFSKGLPNGQAKLIYQGTVQRKSYATNAVSFGLQDQVYQLRAALALDDLSDLPSAKIPPTFTKYKQRLIYGYSKGVRLQNIDQELQLTGYLLEGTVSARNASTTITGTGTTFLAQVSPNDELLIGDSTQTVSVKSVDSDTSITLTEDYQGQGGSALAVRLKSRDPKPFTNRVFKVAGHPLKEPRTTIMGLVTARCYEVDDPSDFRAGDVCILEGDLLTIERISGTRITFLTASSAAVVAGSELVGLSVYNVYLNDRILTYQRDYEYDAEEATVTLDELAEFNVSPVRRIPGTATFSAATRLVTGTSTYFTSVLKPGDWIKLAGEATYYQILSVEDDTNLYLRSLPAYSGTAQILYKSPEYYSEGTSKLTADVLGATVDGTVTGDLIKTGPQAVYDLLARAGLEDLVDTESFDTAQEECPHVIGMVIPDKFNLTTTKTVRDYINQINQSVFGSLFQNQDFRFEYAVLSPRKPEGLTQFAETDALAFSIATDLSRIVKDTKIRYAIKEYDAASGDRSFSEAVASSRSAEYLSSIAKEFVLETVLVDQDSAEIFASRWAFFSEIGSSILSIDTKLKAIRAEINQKIVLEHEKLYERLGSSDRAKIAGVSGVTRGTTGSKIELDDLANAFSRCAIIMDDGANTWDEASDEEKLYGGYITDDYGMQNNDRETFGINLIW